MATVLYVKVNPKADEYSFSARLANDVLAAYKAANPSDEIVTFDVYNEYVPLIDGDVLSAWGKFANGTELTAEEAKKVTRLGEIVDQFAAADKVVFSAPMWNFGFPPLAKAYIDALCVAGKTFKYTENGPVGLLSNKPIVYVEARGGVYSEGPAAAVQHTESYFKAVMGFIGLTDIRPLLVEGVNADPSKAEDIYEAAKANIATALTNF